MWKRIRTRWERLTPRQREILAAVVACTLCAAVGYELGWRDASHSR